LALAALTVGCAVWGGGKLSTDPDRLARQVIGAMGGRRALEKTRYLRWDFVVVERDRIQTRRSYVWDRSGGRCRLETQDKGNAILALFDARTRDGRVFRNNLELPPTAQRQWLDRADDWLLNDSYWLLAATKTFDPGAHRAYVGERPVQGRGYPTLKLWFDNGAGPTLQDHYWFYVDPQTRRPAAWSFVPKGQDAPRATYRWTQWQEVGRLMLPVRFESAAGDRRILIENLYTPGAVDDRVFTQP
jgi:hypothetical protein